MQQLAIPGHLSRQHVSWVDQGSPAARRVRERSPGTLPASVHAASGCPAAEGGRELAIPLPHGRRCWNTRHGQPRPLDLMGTPSSWVPNCPPSLPCHNRSEGTTGEATWAVVATGACLRGTSGGGGGYSTEIPIVCQKTASAMIRVPYSRAFRALLERLSGSATTSRSKALVTRGATIRPAAAASRSA
jgi:hypothetical protein